MTTRRFDLQMIYFLSNSGVVILGSYLVLLFDARGLNENDIGLLAIPFSVTTIISNSLFGRLSDAKGRRPFLLLGLFTASLTTIFYTIPDNFWTFAIAQVMTGITLGIFPASIIGTATDRNMKIGKLASFGSIGWAIGGLIGGFIADYFYLELAFVFGGACYFMAFLTVYLMNTGSIGKKRDDSDKVEKSQNTDYIPVIRENWLVYITLIVRHGTANSIWIFWALFLTDNLGLSTTQIGVVQATNMGTQFVLMNTIGDRYDPPKMFVFGGIMSAVAFFSFTLSQNFFQIVGAQVILGTSWAFFYVGGLRNVTIKASKKNVVATATGLFNASISISQLVGPFLALLLFSLSKNYLLSMKVASVSTIVVIIFYTMVEFRTSIFRSKFS
ncbi:MAG: MFS transporter [Candidatus Kariarchaeaceae archaeon]|jgi:MFS family permease